MDNSVQNLPAGIGRRHHLVVSSWNVEGLTDFKLYQICTYMKETSVDVMCLQETKKLHSDSYWTEYGFKVLLSGASTGSKE